VDVLVVTRAILVTSIEACFESFRLASLFLSSSFYSLGMISAICTWIPLYHIDLTNRLLGLGLVPFSTFPIHIYDMTVALYYIIDQCYMNELRE
jgi:hypothetical protein